MMSGANQNAPTINAPVRSKDSKASACGSSYPQCTVNGWGAWSGGCGLLKRSVFLEEALQQYKPSTFNIHPLLTLTPDTPVASWGLASQAAFLNSTYGEMQSVASSNMSSIAFHFLTVTTQEDLCHGHNMVDILLTTSPSL